MKKLLSTLFLLTCFIAGIQAQNVLQNPVSNVTAIKDKVAKTGAETLDAEIGQNSTRYPGNAIGLTFYDLQSNGSCQRRLAANPNGEYSAVWTMSLDEFDTAYPNRGTGYNATSNGEFGAQPSMRLEDRRVGWPSVNVLPDGSPIVISHTADASFSNGPFNFLKQDPNDGTWTQSEVTSNAAPGMLWPRSVVSSSGTIHAIGITTPVANDGAIYEGLDGHLLYYRSKDGGDTWDQVDIKLPEMDDTNYNAIGGDEYSIDANGTTIAIAHFADWNDITVYKSTDDGDTWTRIVINDFPLDNYVQDTPYSIDDIGGVDTLGPGGNPDADSTALKAIYSSDNSGSVVVDNNGKVHAFYGIMYIADNDYTDGNSNFYPGWNGLAYWNEDMPAGERPIEITGALDENGNGTLDVTDANAIAQYFYSLSSMPYAEVDENNELFLAYSALSETYISTGGQHYRHVYLMKSSDGGESWGEPFDVINEDLFEDDEELFQFVEAVFPSIQVDDKYVHLIYQQDFEPGLAVRGDEDDVFEQEIIYLKIDKSTLTLVENVVRPEALGMSLAPNPSVDFTTISFDMPSEQEVQVQIINLQGQVMKQIDLGNMPSGQHTQRVSTNGLQQGTYIVKLNSGQRAASMKLSVQ